MAKQKTDDAQGGFGTEATVPPPSDDDWLLKEQDGENDLLEPADFMNRQRLMGNE